MHALCRLIASGNMEDPGSLSGNKTTVLEVPVKVPHSVVVSLVRDIDTDWDIDYRLPLSRKGEIKLLSLSDLF